MLGYRRDITNVINTQLNLFDISLNDIYTRLITGSPVNDAYSKAYIDSSFNDVYAKLITGGPVNDAYSKAYIDSSFNNVYIKSYIDTSFNNVYSKAYIDSSFNNVYSKAYIDSSFNDVYSKAYIDSSFNDVYSKAYIDSSFNDVYSKAYIDTSFNNVSNKLDTIDSSIDQLSYSLFVNDVSQTFYEIITQQPYKFAKNDISINSTSIILRWNYDSIIAKHSNNNIAKLANISDAGQNLPFINEIVIDISQNNSWTPIATINISGNYNVDNFKHYIFQRTNTFNTNIPFSLRAYGKNYSNDYPNIETRSLVFDNLTFLPMNAPSNPLFIESDVSYVSNTNNITLTYFNNLSDYLDTYSSAYLTSYSINYSLNSTLASFSSVTIQNNYITICGEFSNIIDSSSNFYITLTNLMSGSNYSHSVKVRNNFLNVYSDYSTISISKYTLLPNDNNIGTSINMSIKAQCYKYISTSVLDNSSILYFNIANSSHSFLFDNSYTQVFQITHPYFSNQESETYGYGKYVDNCSNLVTISLSINNQEKHVINYGGFNLNSNILNSYNYTKTDTSYVFILNNINNINIEDIHSLPNNIGFRLKGYLLLKDEITNNNIVNYFGAPSTDPYLMSFNYNRSANVGNYYSIYKNYNIYVDNLSGNPAISNITSNIIVQDVVYNMSVASIKYSKLLLARTYSNVNSTFKYIIGNRIIADFSHNNSIATSFVGANIILAQIDICANGVYKYDLSYNFAYFQQVKNNYSFNLLEKAYNLNGITNSNISLISKPFCDYNSFNKSNNIIVSSKLDLSALHIYEISNIELLGSDLNNIVLKHYNNHSNKIAPCSLLYLDSKFNNVFSLYPNSNDFSYNSNNNLDISYNTYGNISYDLNGTMLNNNQGYKWIVFKLFKNNNESNSYLFNNISYNIITTTDGNNIKYLPLKIMLKNNNLFLDSIVDKIFDITDNNAVMFGHATTINSDKRYFNIKQNFNGLGGIWTQNSNSNNITYNSSANSKIFGCNVYNDGIYCPINNLNNDLTIYIGLKGA
jgi:hypothetical protein